MSFPEIKKRQTQKQYDKRHLEKLKVKEFSGRPFEPKVSFFISLLCGFVPAALISCYSLIATGEVKKAILVIMLAGLFFSCLILFPFENNQSFLNIPMPKFVSIMINIVFAFFLMRFQERAFIEHLRNQGKTRSWKMPFAIGMLFFFLINPFLFNFWNIHD